MCQFHLFSLPVTTAVDGMNGRAAAVRNIILTTRHSRKEILMQQFLSRLLSGIRKHGSRRPARRPARPIQLVLEAMEDRLVPSTAVSGLNASHLAPALTASLETSGGHAVASPEQNVHGYKWRRPRPWATSSALDAYHAQIARSSHLFLGGTDGRTASIASDGHIVVRVPEGPLPIDLTAGKG
jgi:hypothetical protein